MWPQGLRRSHPPRKHVSPETVEVVEEHQLHQPGPGADGTSSRTGRIADHGTRGRVGPKDERMNHSITSLPRPRLAARAVARVA
jgi:hypothetical protein